jgi:hypothetical protein
MVAVVLVSNVTAAQCAVLCMGYMTCSKYYHVASSEALDAGNCMSADDCTLYKDRGCAPVPPGPKPCNTSGACLVCDEHPRRIELERSHSLHTQMWLSSDCTKYVAGGNHMSNYTLTRARHVEVFASNATLGGYLDVSVPMTMRCENDSTTFLGKKMNFRGKSLRMIGTYAINATVGGIVIAEVKTTAQIDTLRADHDNPDGVGVLALGHVQGSVAVRTCTGHVYIQNIRGEVLASTFGGCTVVDVGALLDTFGSMYEMVFFNGEMSALAKELPKLMLLYTTLAASTMFFLLAIVHGPLVCRMASNARKR